MFHNLLAKTLYTKKCARPDTCTLVSFLTIRVREPNKDDWGTLVHLMKYIRGTRDLPLVLSDNVSGVLNWCIGESYAVHPNIWGHTCGIISTRRIFNIVNSTEKKLNTLT